MSQIKNKIYHKFNHQNSLDDFQCELGVNFSCDAPEVIIIGTFNPDLPWNHADFYYGRNGYMWPILSNIFTHNYSFHHKPRTKKNRVPSYKEIVEICNKTKLGFTDLINSIETKDEVLLDKKSRTVHLGNNSYISNYSDKTLNNLGRMKYLNSNTENIISFVKKHQTIKHIIYTFNNNGKWFKEEVNKIKSQLDQIEHHHIFTPTGQGFRRNLEPPYDSRIKSLSHCWIWNGLEAEKNLIKGGYERLPTQWLNDQNVQVDNF